VFVRCTYLQSALPVCNTPIQVAVRYFDTRRINRHTRPDFVQRIIPYHTYQVTGSNRIRATDGEMHEVQVVLPC
jgi:hypothetical protein